MSLLRQRHIEDLLHDRPNEREGVGVQDVQLPEGNPMLGGRLTALRRYEWRGGNLGLIPLAVILRG